MENRLEPTGTCWCGCGGETRPGSFFISNHDRIAEARVIRSEYGSIAGLLAAHGYGPGGKSLQQRSGGQDAEGARAPWQDMEEDLGFKRLTPENWLEPDSVMRAFGRLPPVGEPYIPMGEERVSDAMGIELAESVPLEVRRLFAVARGALCYGYFFYPLYALACEQLFRVAETAVTRKYVDLGGPENIKTSKGKTKKADFKDKLDYLEREGIITGDDVIWWGAIRELRNLTSHPQDHHPQIPGQAVGQAKRLAEKIDGLFAAS
jgi:hypothetical protein